MCIEVEGEELQLGFNWNVIDMIQDQEHMTVEDILMVMQGEDARKAREIAFMVLCYMTNDAIEEYNERNKKKLREVTIKQVKRMYGWGNVHQMQLEVIDVMADSLPMNDENEDDDLGLDTP